MGVICVKRDKDDLKLSSRSSESMSPNKQHRNTIKTKMDKTQYQRLQVIKQYLNDSNTLKKSIKQQQQNDRQINDFKFIRHLGDGSYGQVVLVKDIKSGQLYAMKIIKKQLILERQQILNALSQRYILAAMDHPFVVKLHYAFQTKNKVFLIVDLMAGGQLFFLLRKNKKFVQENAKFYAAEILLALEYLHTKNIIYRDLKPQNVLLDRQGHIKLTDFGLSKVVLKNNQVTTSICGTPEYIAPQVLKGKGYTIMADWFSFGSLLYDMLTGKPPFYSKDKQDMMKKIQTKQIPFPEYLSQSAKSLLKSLFQKKQQNRLGFKSGVEQIKKHAFFKNINFDDIYKKKVKPPFSFQDSINSQGFAIKFDQFAVQQSYEKQIVQKSKGVNFQGFSYHVKKLKVPESKVQVSQFQMKRNQTLKTEKDDLEMEDNEIIDRKQRQQLNTTKDQSKQSPLKQNPAQNPGMQTPPTKLPQLLKKSTFSMSLHQIQKKKSQQQQSAKKSQTVKPVPPLQTIKQTPINSTLNINLTFNNQSMNSPNKQYILTKQQIIRKQSNDMTFRKLSNDGRKQSSDMTFRKESRDINERKQSSEVIYHQENV